MEQCCGEGDSSAGFGYQVRIECEAADCFADFVLAHGDESVYIALDVFEVTIADALSAESVSNGAGGFFGGKGEALTGFETGLSFGAELRLDSIKLWAGSHILHCGANAADHTAASDTHQHGSGFRQVREDLESHRALPGDDGLVII